MRIARSPKAIIGLILISCSILVFFRVALAMYRTPFGLMWTNSLNALLLGAFLGAGMVGSLRLLRFAPKSQPKAKL